MKTIPSAYIDETGGIRGEKNQDTFNNVVYTFWYCMAKYIKGTIEESDIQQLRNHLVLNGAEQGNYLPKMSHDNITYWLLANEFWNLKLPPKFNLKMLRAVWARPWDLALYTYVLTPGPLKLLFKPFLCFTAMHILHACKVGEKTRPSLLRSDRKYWWFRKKKLVQVDHSRGYQTVKVWEDYKGCTRFTYHMLNDGKHLSIFKLLVFGHLFPKTKEKCRLVLRERFGAAYTAAIIGRYFKDRRHPVIKQWYDTRDILEEQ
jgi:hypothetical protein